MHVISNMAYMKMPEAVFTILISSIHWVFLPTAKIAHILCYLSVIIIV